MKTIKTWLNEPVHLTPEFLTKVIWFWIAVLFVFAVIVIVVFTFGEIDNEKARKTYFYACLLLGMPTIYLIITISMRRRKRKELANKPE
jgi:hypothetical protein